MCASEFCYYCGSCWDDEHLLTCVKAVDEGLRQALDVDEVTEYRVLRRRRRRRLRKKLKEGGIIGRTFFRFRIVSF